MSENPFFDDMIEPDPLLNRITDLIIAACIEVHRLLGPGYLEVYYERALAEEFDRRGIKYTRQHPFEVEYKGKVIGSGFCDFIVEGSVIVEIKSIAAFAPIHTSQLLSYLRAMNLRLGLLINFNVSLLKHGIKRVAR